MRVTFELGEERIHVEGVELLPAVGTTVEIAAWPSGEQRTLRVLAVNHLFVPSAGKQTASVELAEIPEGTEGAHDSV